MDVSRFEYLDSLRGLSAFSVLTTHVAGPDFLLHGHLFGVFEFFLMSSFLLTYQLLIKLEKASQTNLAEKFHICLSYLITRFFRVYIPFVIIITLAHQTSFVFFTKSRNKPLPLYRYILLDFNTLPNSDHTFYWTIPVEIFYYFWIPLIALFSLKFNLCNIKFACVTYIIVITSAILIQFKIYSLFSGSITSLKYNISIFLCGSATAILYKSFRDEKIIEIIKDKKYLSKLIMIFTYVMLFIGFRLSYLGLYHRMHALYWCVHMLLMLIGSPNHFTDMLSNFVLLKVIGKYSYGFYLWHGFSISLYNQIVVRIPFLEFHIYKWIVLTILSLTFGYFNYHIVEENCIKLAKKINFYLAEILVKKEQNNPLSLQERNNSV